MKNTKREISSGGIIFFRNDGLYVLLIRDAYGRWTWPKGKIDRSETPLEAAIREINEETGITAISKVGEADQVNYCYRMDGVLIYKTVHYFIFDAAEKARPSAQTSEIDAAEWMEFECALRMLSYDGAAELLKKAGRLYEKSGVKKRLS